MRSVGGAGEELLKCRGVAGRRGASGEADPFEARVSANRVANVSAEDDVALHGPPPNGRYPPLQTLPHNKLG